MPREGVEAGRFTFFDPGSDKPVLEVGTLSCAHCGGQWIPRPGSGIVRGFCQRCNGYICGPGCEACVPLDQYLSNLEAGRDPHFRPIIVPTSFGGE